MAMRFVEPSKGFCLLINTRTWLALWQTRASFNKLSCSREVRDILQYELGSGSAGHALSSAPRTAFVQRVAFPCSPG